MYGHATQSVKSVKTEQIEIYIAGDAADARRSLREFCKKTPCCVTLSKTDFIYKGGLESGVVVGVRHYPRFPTDHASLASRARQIADLLLDVMSQDSYMIVDLSGATLWVTSRE